MKHYTYLICKESTGEYYIGVRSCVGDPQDDPYMGSSKFLKARLAEGDWFKYIIQEYRTRKEAGLDESQLTEGHLNNGLCLNRSRGGNCWSLMTPDIRKRIAKSVSKSLKGRKFTVAHRNALRKPKTPQHCAAISAAKRGKKMSQATKDNLSRYWKGKKRPEVSAAQLGQKRPAISAALKGRKMSPEWRAKMAEARHRWWAKKRTTQS